ATDGTRPANTSFEYRTEGNMRAKYLFLVVIVFGALHTNLASAQTWTQTSAPSNNWTTVACSADGRNLVAVAGCSRFSLSNDGFIYASTNAGVTWDLSNAPRINWSSVAASAAGAKFVATVGACGAGGGIYAALDSGVTWSMSGAPVRPWLAVASSADG